MDEKGFHLRENIVENPSVSINPKLSKTEKVKHHISKKTHKFIVLRV